MEPSKKIDATAIAKEKVIMKTKARWTLYREGRDDIRSRRSLEIRMISIGGLGFRMGGPGSFGISISSAMARVRQEGQDVEGCPPCEATMACNKYTLETRSEVEASTSEVNCRRAHCLHAVAPHHHAHA